MTGGTKFLSLLAAFGALVMTYAAGFAGGIISGHPNRITQPHQQPASSDVTNTLQNVAAMNDQQAERAHRLKYEAECDPSNEKRDSDLCAQWKAADAAADSARWTYVGNWIGGVSGFLVLIALGFAFEANKIARDTAKRQLRAYMGFLSYKVTPIHDDQEGMTRTGGVLVNLKNYGQTPAVALTTVVSLGFRKWSGERELPEKWEYVSDELPIDVAPSGAMHRTISMPVAVLEHWEDLPSGKVALYVQVRTCYSDVFGRSHEQTTRFTSRGQQYREGEMVVWRQSRET